MNKQKFSQRQLENNSHLVRNIFIVLVGLVLLSILFLLFYFFVLPDEERCLNVNCDDGNPCTIDECSLRTGICYHPEKKCPEGQKCNINSGDCELIVQEEGILDEIEQAVSEELENSNEETTTDSEVPVEEPVDPMDEIEDAIKDALVG